MELKLNQFVYIYSRSVIDGKKELAIIKEIHEASITLALTKGSHYISAGTNFGAFFYGNDSTFAFTCKALKTKKSDEYELHISKPDNFIRMKNRIAQRHDTRTSGFLITKNGHGFEPCNIHNISDKGIKISSKIPLNMADPILMELAIRGQAFRNIPGKIRWCSGSKDKSYQYGVEFEMNSLMTQHQIRDLIKRILPST